MHLFPSAPSSWILLGLASQMAMAQLFPIDPIDPTDPTIEEPSTTGGAVRPTATVIRVTSSRVPVVRTTSRVVLVTSSTARPVPVTSAVPFVPTPATSSTSSASSTATATAVAAKTSGSSSPNVGAILGGIIGGAVLIAACLIYIFRKTGLKKSRDFKDRLNPNYYPKSDDMMYQHEKALPTYPHSTGTPPPPPASTAGSIASSGIVMMNTSQQMAYYPDTLDRQQQMPVGYPVAGGQQPVQQQTYGYPQF